MKIFTKHTLKQFVQYTLASLLLFTFILLMERVFQLAELVINKGVAFTAVITLLAYSLPTILVLAAPMAGVAGVILSFGRMASEKEITAIRTSGSTLGPIVIPVILAGIIFGIFMIPFNLYIAPIFQFEFRKHFINIASQDPTLQIEENTIMDISPYTLLCSSVDRDKQMLGEVLIFKDAVKENPAISINADQGSWKILPDGSTNLTLYSGVIKHIDGTNPAHFTSILFEEHTMMLQAPKSFQRVSNNLEAMTAGEIKEEITRLKNLGHPTHQVRTQYHLRSALAIAIPILLITGIPLGVRAEKKGRTIGVGISIFVIAAYYFLMVAGLKLAFNETIPPIIGAWMGNIITLILGVFMLKRVYAK